MTLALALALALTLTLTLALALALTLALTLTLTLRPALPLAEHFVDQQLLLHLVRGAGAGGGARAFRPGDAAQGLFGA